MINFLHSFTPNPVLLSFKSITVYWYGFFVFLGLVVGISVALYLIRFYGISRERFLDLFFIMVVFGIIGARIYHVLLEFSYYSQNLSEIVKIWHGGIAIHGAVIGGLLAIWLFVTKFDVFEDGKERTTSQKFWIISAIAVAGLSIAQAIGRWGNYFNQELFGKPTKLPWGIPIDFFNRPTEYMFFKYFHPTFLYESIGSLIIFAIVLFLHRLALKKKISVQTIVLIYASLYSILRFSLEFLRLDVTPEIFHLRLPQVVSILIILFVLVLTARKKYYKLIK